MAFITTVIGPPKRAIWEELSKELGAEFVKGGVWKSDKVVVKHKNWEITLDTYTVSTGKYMIEYTRMRSPFVSNDGLRFHLFRKNIVTKLGKWFGKQFIEVGCPEFDRAFVLRGNNPLQLAKFFADKTVRDMLLLQKRFDFKILDDEGWLGSKFPSVEDELYLEIHGVIKDKELLKSLFALFSASLNQLNLIGTASSQPAMVHLK